MNYEEAQVFLRLTASTLSDPYKALCNRVINTTEFLFAPAAQKHHHAYAGGLVVHTAEVLENCKHALEGGVELDRDILYTAAIWHDYLKIRDYRKIGVEQYEYTDYKRQIYHIAGSFAEWNHRAMEYGLPQDKIDAVGHCILSHHFCPEWGSAIRPQTPEATTLCWADQMSAWFENGKYKEYK